MAGNNDNKETSLEARLRDDYFGNYDTSVRLPGTNLCVAAPTDGRGGAEREWLMWAVRLPARMEGKEDIADGLARLILAIGRQRMHERQAPPRLLAAIGAETIAFMPYEEVMEVFAENDFNWNVAPSNRSTREWRRLRRLVDKRAAKGLRTFSFGKDDRALRRFVGRTLKCGGAAGLPVTRANFAYVFHRWMAVVKPTIGCVWDVARGYGIDGRDFFLADIFHKGGARSELNVQSVAGGYVVRRGASLMGGTDLTEVPFADPAAGGRDGMAHRRFWSLYRRPARKADRNFMLSRRHLLSPPDARAWKGAFFTPELWVRKSHECLADCLGADWQRQYCVWDCTAGTGNMEAGLTNSQNVWASTIDQSDVDTLHARIAAGMNLMDSHVFRFDFLNDSFDNLPDGLRQTVTDPERRKRLVVYFNPPSAEAGSSRGKAAKTGVANRTRAHGDYAAGLGSYAKRELGAQFLMRICRELPGCTIGVFAKLKILQSPYFRQFRQQFGAALRKMFIVPADTFDNVRGSFPYAFMVFDTKEREVFARTVADAYGRDGRRLGGKTILSYDGMRLLNDWLRPTWGKGGEAIGWLVCNGNDFGHQNEIVIQSRPGNTTSTFFKPITPANLTMSAIYLAVRKCVPATWENDRDQFLFPNDGWRTDREFQGDCLAYALFDNVVRAKYGPNHWIPYTEEEVGAKGTFSSHFMHDFMEGLTPALTSPTPSLPDRGGRGNTLFPIEAPPLSGRAGAGAVGPFVWSPAAKAVLAAGRALWRYYHAQPGAQTDASFYDIRLHFQGSRTSRSGKARMNATSSDEEYMRLIAALRSALKALARAIEPKVYEYGFLV